VNADDFEYLRAFLRQRSGLVISADKQYLVESRLLPVARRRALLGIGDLVHKLRASESDALVNEIIEAMATKESFFFRDKIPFEQFRDTIVPALIRSRAARRRVRIWCAAASTGQEPYSLAMSLAEISERLADWRIDIIATDLSQDALAKAQAGIYNQFEVQRGLPIALLLKYFRQRGENWEIAPAIRAMVQFRQLNLLGDFDHLGLFDVVFCRNVLIYFDQPTKTAVLDRVGRAMESDGFLVLGAAETVVGLTNSLRPLVNCRGLYAPNVPTMAAQSRSNPAPSLRIVAAR
jgi:chemotaxis protein methyltransferase CheR